jgi:hypothetical protein
MPKIYINFRGRELTGVGLFGPQFCHREEESTRRDGSYLRIEGRGGH